MSPRDLVAIAALGVTIAPRRAGAQDLTAALASETPNHWAAARTPWPGMWSRQRPIRYGRRPAA